MRRYIPIVLAFTTLLAAPPALAQTAGAANADRGMALNEAGMEAFESGDFVQAAQNFAQAYELAKEPSLRKNETIAWFKAGRCEDAVASGNKYLLGEGADDEDRSQVNAVLANCKVEFAEDAVDAGSLDVAEKLLAEAELLEPDQHVRDRIALLQIGIAKQRRPDDADADAVAARESSPESTVPLWKWGMIGGGAAVVLAAGVYHAVALGWQGRFLDMTETGGAPDEFESLRTRVHTARVMVPILYGVGIATAGTGAVLLFAVESNPETTAGSQRPTIRFAISGRF